MKDETPTRDDLRATSDSIRHDAERVTRLETVKVSLDPRDPRVDSISREVEELASDLVEKAKVERDLAQEAKTSDNPGRAN